MKYYKIEEDYDAMGYWIQSQSPRITKRIPDEMVGYGGLNEERDKELFLEPIMLVRRANITDYISCIYINPLMGIHAISKKMFNILKNFNLPKHKVKRVDVIARDKTVYKNYIILYTTEIFPPNPVDYNKTTFRHENKVLHKGEYEIKDIYQVASKHEYEITLKELKLKYKGLVNKLIFEKAFLPKDFSLDFFKIANGYLGMNVISEKLKEALQAEGITGLLYEEIEWLNN